jgi:chromosome segregation ATPase
MSDDTPATKGDINEIKHDIEKLTMMIANGFEHTTTDIRRLDERMTNVETDLSSLKTDVASVTAAQSSILKVVLALPSEESFNMLQAKVDDHGKRLDTVERQVKKFASAGAS